MMWASGSLVWAAELEIDCKSSNNGQMNGATLLSMARSWRLSCRALPITTRRV